MSDLAELAEDVAKDLPAQVRKVIDTALANGWELAKPGMTLALRLDNPTDELAQPVYICWAVGRTEKGRLSMRFVSCSTRGLVPLSGADLLEYLADPTVAYLTDEDIAELEAAQHEKARKKWDASADPVTNLTRTLGAEVIGIEVERPNRPPRAYQPPKRPEVKTSAPKPTRALRVTIPTA